MTEPIKQEIINNIFENGDKLITGPILQTVLIDMIDDVNVKDQEILSKTGSWDDAATQIPNLATKAEVTNLSESVARDLENVVGGDLTGYATEQWVQDQGYLTEHQDISNLATKAEVTNLSESVARDLANVPEGVATEAWVQSQDYASKSYVDNAISSSSVDLTGYATETWVQNQGYLTEHQDISGLATKSELNSVSESIQTDISNLATKGELNDAKNNLQGNITSLSESVANSAVWKKGEGQNSIVQKLPAISTTGVYSTPIATGEGAIATGYSKASGNNSHAEGDGTTAEGLWSHAEGYGTNASGASSHAEGQFTIASGIGSHAEGSHTSASNDYEHAQGRFNHSSENQIFSVGAGEMTPSFEITRRNAISVLAVNNNGSHTASFFVQNIGGYDGTNPLPGTNDLATVVSKVSSIWKKGEGGDSIVQKVTNTTLTEPTATGIGAVAIGDETRAEGEASHAEGYGTNASGHCSHAEGYSTSASGVYSHAEGDHAKASGMYSHAEGYQTNASNEYEHAQGKWNHTSANQIFSVGAGDYGSRRNAVSVLAVRNNNSNTGSFFVQNVGGYDGTNPTPGTNDLATVINNLSSSVGSSSGGSSETLWEKGTGEDSLVQKLTGGNEANTPTASGIGAVAIGTATTASGNNSHAEGQTTVASGLASHAEGYNTIASAHCSHAEGGDTKASGSYSHAEGIYTEALAQASHTEGYRTTASREGSHAEGESTIASGSYSHAEGGYTLTSNQYEHAQGQYNHNSTNQIFSVGAGEKIGETVTRRNAVSILEVPNSETQVVTASVFVQNIGGYDGTNPEPGTNDLATVISGLSSGGGSSETLWKKGTGQDSIAQVIADGTNLPTASGDRAIATGYATTASGEYSHAEGYTSIASGKASHAEGLEAKATGQYSHAEGTWTRAAGYGSHVEGYFSKASGRYSHAKGYETEASGEHSHTEGYKVIASGKYSHAEGCLTSTTNWYEHAQGICNHTSTNQIFSVGAGEITNPDYPDFASTKTRRNAISVLAVPNSGSYTSSFFVQNIGGYDGTNPLPGTNDLATVINNLPSGGGSSETLWKKGTGQDSVVQVITGVDEARKPKATGTGSIATGYYTVASGEYSHAEGHATTASGSYSRAEGNLTIASGNTSHAEGDHAKATGDYSHAEGSDTEASAWASHVEGYGTKALKSYGHAEGYYAKASGKYSHAEGNQTLASGEASHVEGYCTTASGECSHAEGNHTSASNAYEHAQGIANYNSTNQIFSIGAGEVKDYYNVTRRNALSVLSVPNSDTQINTASVFIQNIGGYNGTNPLPGTNDLATVINGLSSGGGSSETLWKKGTGTDSIVQKVTDTILTEPIASGVGAVAIGDKTKASGQASHAEGYWTEAKGNHSHAEGRENTAEGVHSHTEGFNTIASNDYEHAQGIRNYSSTNQIFSVGAGDYTGDYVEASDRRRNAISVLAVPNSETQVVTASFFVQNVGGYDGTNPTPGTNDLATVLNNTETWTFTLEDGSTVTKNIRIS